MAKKNPKTVQIFLPDGNARSVRIAQVTSRTVQAVQIPRSNLKVAGDRSEIQRVGSPFYSAERRAAPVSPTAYIGEAENCYKRVCYHHRHREFWDTTVAVTSKTRSFTKAHARYLEYDCLQMAQEAGRFRLENDHLPEEPHIPEPMLAELRDNFGTIQTLLSALGFPVLDQIRTDESQKVLYCTSGDADATGEYTEDGLVVFEGSIAAPETVPSATEATRRRRRERSAEGILAEQGGALVFTEDYVFGSPSGAAVVVTGASINGWSGWKDADGHDKLERD